MTHWELQNDLLGTFYKYNVLENFKTIKKIMIRTQTGVTMEQLQQIGNLNSFKEFMKDLEKLNIITSITVDKNNDTIDKFNNMLSEYKYSCVGHPVFTMDINNVDYKTVFDAYVNKHEFNDNRGRKYYIVACFFMDDDKTIFQIEFDTSPDNLDYEDVIDFIKIEDKED